MSKVSPFEPSPGQGLRDRSPYKTRCRGVYLPRARVYEVFAIWRDPFWARFSYGRTVPHLFFCILPSSRGQVATVSGIWPEFYDSAAHFYIIEPRPEWFKRHSGCCRPRGRFSTSPFLPALSPFLPVGFVRRLINLCSRHRAAEMPVRRVSPLIPPLGRTNGTAPARYARKSADCPFELSGPITCGCVPGNCSEHHYFQTFPRNLRELIVSSLVTSSIAIVVIAVMPLL